MDTSGHTQLSAIGEALLKPALAKGNSGKEMRISAFYLGNWLTDVSQCIDPVAYGNAAMKVQKIETAISGMFEKMRFDAPAWLPDPIEDLLEDLDGLRRSLDQAQKALFESVKGTLEAGENGALAEGFKYAFRYVGYFKFVLDDGGKPTEMDKDVYFKLFDARFTQYFPHEHLDRPEVKEGVYDTKKATGPLNKRTKSDTSLDLYAYLRSDILLAAGLLSYLDAGHAKVPQHRSWAAGTFHKHRTQFLGRDGEIHPIDDTDYEWNYHLAMLGHALHAVEDYFAHSTFVEHASRTFPSAYKRFERLEDEHLHEVLARRLKQWRPGFQDDKDDWKKLPNDTHVVTGYFDFTDTLISLSHLLDHLFDLPGEKAGQKVDKLIEYNYVKLLTDTIELVSDPKQVWYDEKNNPKAKGYDEREGNLAVKMLREGAGKGLQVAEGKDSINKLVGLVLDLPLLKGLPPTVRTSFDNAVKVLGGVVVGVKIYKTLKSFYDFFTNPLAWLAKYIPKKAYELLKELGVAYLKDLVLDYLGAKRIGCHSLIAKDSGPELFHDAAMECAKATHWYVVHVMTRHFQRAPIDAARSDQKGKNPNNLPPVTPVDWLELLEYFLCHPLARVNGLPVKKELSVSIVHVTRRDPSSKMSLDSLGSLAKEYSKTFMPVPGGPDELTWEVIADANFPTKGLGTEQKKRAINRILKHQETGLKVSDGVNYAFKPDLKIVIPYQRSEHVFFKGPGVERQWWRPVILEDDGYKAITKWFDASGNIMSSAPKYAHRPFPIDKEAADSFYEEVLARQNELRKAYQGGALMELY